MDLGPLPGGRRDDEAAAFGRLGLAGEEADQRLVVQLPRDQHRAADGGADTVHRGLHQHAVEAEARGLRQVRRGQALAGEPVRPVRIPAQVVEQRPVLQVGRAAEPATRREQGGAADGEELLLVERLLEQGVRDVLATADFVHCRGLDATRPDSLHRAGPDAPSQPPRSDRGHQRRARRAVGHPAHEKRQGRGRMPATHPGPPP